MTSMKPMTEETRKKMPTIASTPSSPRTISLSSWSLKMTKERAEAVRTSARRMIRNTVPGRAPPSTIGMWYSPACCNFVIDPSLAESALAWRMRSYRNQDTRTIFKNHVCACEGSAKRRARKAMIRQFTGNLADRGSWIEKPGDSANSLAYWKI